ncbi:MAG: Gfo/Idh/MocA family oxidoreductase [bacterium]
MKTPVRVAVVGCGAQSQLAHIPALRQNRNVEIVALCDPDIRKINHLRRLHGIDRYYLDFDDLTADEGIDACVIATPNHLHAPMAIAAMEYGKDVLCEVPLALNSEEASAMIATAERLGRRLVPCLNTRLRPDVQTIRRFIEGGELGDVYYCKTGWLQGREMWSLEGWRGQRIRAGGGAFLSLGTPLLDFALWLLRPRLPRSITGVVHLRPGRSDVEDTAFAMLRFDDDVLLTVEVGWSVTLENDFRYFNAFGSAGAALLNPVQIHKEMHGHLVNVTPRIPTKGMQRASHKLLADLWIDSLVRDVAPAIPAADALLINQLADAFYLSATEHREVKLTSAGS